MIRNFRQFQIAAAILAGIFGLSLTGFATGGS